MSTLITGFPGFIGKRLVGGLLERDSKLNIVALVEPRMVPAAQDAAGEIEGGDRIEVVAGDISERRLGLDDETYERLAGSTRTIYHLAAIYDLAVPKEIAQKVNVDGTGNVLEFCLDCDKLERHNYVSTAYVAGERTGSVYEHELALGQAHKNFYESTKFQAEVWVRELIDQIPTTIFRPAIVVGDSQTGETQKFDGPYYVLRYLSKSAERPGPIARFGKSEALFNVVPVDFIVGALIGLGDHEAATGETLHLVDPDPLTAADLFNILSREYLGKEPTLALPAKMVEAAMRSAKLREMFGGSPQESLRYLNHPVRFDTRRATELLSQVDMRCPGFPEYVGPMVEFFRAHEADPAFAPGHVPT